jgi:integrase
MSTLDASRRAIAPASAAPASAPAPTPTLATVLAHVLADPALTARQRQDTASAIRTLAKAFGRPLDELSAHPAELRARLAGFAPTMAGLTKTRWRNALSLLRGALKSAGLTWMAARSRAPLAPAWTALIRLFDGKHQAIPLCRLARYCSARGIAPADVDDTVFQAFGRDLAEGSLIGQPHKVLQRAAIVWNQAASRRPAWPGQTVAVPDRRRTYILPWTAFPASLEADVQAYLDRLAGKDILDELDFRPLKPASLQTQQYRLRAYLAALVHRGRDPQTITRLRDVVAVDTVKDGLRYFIKPGRDASTSRAYDIASVVTPMARHWAGIDEQDLKALRAFCKRLQPRRTGMTVENQKRLRPFDDPTKARALITLPVTLLAEMAGKVPTRREALVMQTALAIELLLMQPIRLKNLAHLELGRHLIRNGKRMQLAIPSDEVKNGMEVEATLPAPTVRLLDLYVTRCRPLLTETPSAWLFPGRGAGGQPKCLRQLRTQIGTLVKRRCGLVVNPHLFRHIAAKLYLKAHPGAYGVVRLLLGHKSVNTTTKYYCGTETAAALRHFDDFILSLRQTQGLRQTQAPGTSEEGR